MRHTAIALIILLSLQYAVRAEPPTGVPDVHIGDRWTFQQRDGLTDDLRGEFTRRVVTVTPAEITAVQQVKGRPGETVNYFTREWNLEDNGTAKFDPNLTTLHFPMRVGDTWQGQYKSRMLTTGATSACHIVLKVTSRETIKIAAGSYDTLRVDGKAECRGADSTAAPVMIINGNWYAPGVHSIIKTVSSLMFEGRERSRTVTEMLNYSLADRAEPAPGERPRDQTPSGQGPATPSAVPSAPSGKGI